MINNIAVSDNFRLQLRCINWSDLENLRNWKNKNKEAFFFQKEITPQMQQQWFKEYLQREHDYLYIVEYNYVDIGCMGIRLTESTWDIYNVILGQREYGGKRLMSQALTTMIKFAQRVHDAPVSLIVIKGNAALLWYQRQGFVIKETLVDSFFMQLPQT